VFAWRAFRARPNGSRDEPSPGAYLAVSGLAELGVRALFTTRQGGFSNGDFSTLNLSFVSGDDPDVVVANRARALEAIGAPAEAWTSGRQVHGAQVARVTSSERGRGSRSAATTLEGTDAMWTEEPGTVLAVLTADCMPILLADRSQRRIAVVHAGWRGLTAGIIEATVGAMGSAHAALVAAVGPSIGPCCYEIGTDVDLDLWRGAREALRRAGVAEIHAAALCTRCEPHRFFSHRAGDRARQGLLASIDPG
jgi:copper oxidase (laccase) domain-containing protein